MVSSTFTILFFLSMKVKTGVITLSLYLISSQISSTYLHILFLCLFHEQHKPKMRNQRKTVIIKLYYLEQWWTCYSSYLISGEFWFNLCWFRIPFVSLPQKTKDIENQPRLKKINLKSKSTCDRPAEPQQVRGPPSLHPSAQCRYWYLLLHLQVLQLHPLQVECVHHDSEGLHSCIKYVVADSIIKVALLGIGHLGIRNSLQ